jgi:hypothetical protein
MTVRQLRALIQAGHYEPDPGQVAAAMLARPGVRTFLTRDLDRRAGRDLEAQPRGSRGD